MTDAERLLIAAIKHEDESVISKISKEWLDVKELKSYKFVTEYYREHGELPGLNTLCDTFHFDKKLVDSRPSIYLKKLKERYIITEIGDNVPGLLRKLTKEPVDVLNEIAEIASRLKTENTLSKDTQYSDNTEDRILRYEKRSSTGGVTYLSMGNALLDKLFHGYNRIDLVTFGGRAGSKKSWLLCLLAILCEKSLPEDLGDILFITNEMDSDEIKDRMDCIRFELSYPLFLTGDLSRRKFREYRDGLAELSRKKSRIKIVEHCKTTDDLAIKLGIYRPSITFIDGSYLLDMHLGEGWEKITTITRTLKSYCKDFQSPIINTTQLRKGTGKSEKSTAFEAQDDFAYSNSYVQDSDLAIRMYQTPQMIYQQEVGLQIAKGRRTATETELIFLSDLYNMAMGFDVRDSEIATDVAPPFQM